MCVVVGGGVGRHPGLDSAFCFFGLGVSDTAAGVRAAATRRGEGTSLGRRTRGRDALWSGPYSPCLSQQAIDLGAPSLSLSLAPPRLFSLFASPSRLDNAHIFHSVTPHEPTSLCAVQAVAHSGGSSKACRSQGWRWGGLPTCVRVSQSLTAPTCATPTSTRLRRGRAGFLEKFY